MPPQFSVSLHKCSGSAAIIEKMQSKLRTYTAVGSAFAWRTTRALISAIGEIPDVFAKGFFRFLWRIQELYGCAGFAGTNASAARDPVCLRWLSGPGSFGEDRGDQIGGEESPVEQFPDLPGLSRDSVVHVTALVTLNKTDLSDRIGNVPANIMDEVDRGLRRVLDLWR